MAVWNKWLGTLVPDKGRGPCTFMDKLTVLVYPETNSTIKHIIECRCEYRLP